MAMARRFVAMNSTYTSWHPSIYKGCPQIPIPIDLVTEGSKHAGKNRVDIKIEPMVTAS
jgi:hypothetical protein